MTKKDIESCKDCVEITYASGHFPTPYECKLTGNYSWLDRPKKFIDGCPKGYRERLA